MFIEFIDSNEESLLLNLDLIETVVTGSFKGKPTLEFEQKDFATRIEGEQKVLGNIRWCIRNGDTTSVFLCSKITKVL